MKIVIDLDEAKYKDILHYQHILEEYERAVYWAIYNGEVLDTGKEEAEKNVADIISQYCMETQEKSIKPINDNVALGWEYK